MASTAQQQQIEFDNPTLYEDLMGRSRDKVDPWFIERQCGFSVYTVVHGLRSSPSESFFSANLDRKDRPSMVAFGFGASVILFFIDMWRLLSNHPFSWGFGVSPWARVLVVLVWSLTVMNPHLFDDLTPAQADAAKVKLPAPPDSNEYQISSLMYERSTDDTTNAIRNIHAQITEFHPSTTEVGPHSLGQPGGLFCALLGNKATKHGEDIVARWFIKSAEIQRTRLQALLRLSEEEQDSADHTLNNIDETDSSCLLQMLLNHSKGRTLLQDSLPNILENGTFGIAGLRFLATQEMQGIPLLSPRLVANLVRRILQTAQVGPSSWYNGVAFIDFMLRPMW
ncbi:hypothetical protein M407DRAFT_33621 [Tulasnella calospora MUT 4182]|uniref:Uncharacterized protein n=1 Tax=Tulasnella calospora MUT 4182 TaxID=1051891 RepID=A0A0C3Q1Z4_9AGAM|nr:hypothetical protein M407DRAFT_33621 [Tulasnella calospora MUT 4182]